MDRRGFLQTAGYGSVALVSFPASALPAWADTGDDPTNFHFMAVSTTGMVSGVIHNIIMGGQGEFSGSQVAGGGFFIHYDDVPPVPKPVLASGTWRAREAMSFELSGTYGVQGSGILEMRIELLRQLPSPAAPMPGTLRVVCNIGAAGLQTGEDEGYVLTVAGLPPFRPMVPALGLTAFSTVALPASVLGGGAAGAAVGAPVQIPSSR
jgi:hypothetical protein